MPHSVLCKSRFAKCVPKHKLYKLISRNYTIKILNAINNCAFQSHYANKSLHLTNYCAHTVLRNSITNAQNNRLITFKTISKLWLNLSKVGN